MSAAWGDVNRDGLMDIYVGNMFSSAGNRITFQPGFQPGTRCRHSRRAATHGQRATRCSWQTRRADFATVAGEAGVHDGALGLELDFLADLNNDGWHDLVVANGYLTADSQTTCEASSGGRSCRVPQTMISPKPNPAGHNREISCLE